jgi:hypothetical protein
MRSVTTPVKRFVDRATTGQIVIMDSVAGGVDQLTV